MLRNEHEKTIKVVQKTEKKAFDVYKAKVRQEEKVRE